MDVPLYTAVLGGEVVVPTPDGKRLFVKVPPETQSGRQIRLAKKGMPLTLTTPDARGDLLVTLHVQVPTKLTDEEKRLFEELRALRRTGKNGGAGFSLVRDWQADEPCKLNPVVIGGSMLSSLPPPACHHHYR